MKKTNPMSVRGHLVEALKDTVAGLFATFAVDTGQWVQSIPSGVQVLKKRGAPYNNQNARKAQDPATASAEAPKKRGCPLRQPKRLS